MGYQSGGHSRTGTTEHRHWAKAVKRRDGYRCQQCGYQGSPKANPADVEADHIVNVAAGGAELDLDNGQTLCRACHDKKSQGEAARARAAKSRRRPPRVRPRRTGSAGASREGGTPSPHPRRPLRA
ncbi:hypothetical protein GS462_11150 [Rhodococcus hoagii]|nr:hypothetical protein [Prescottella equi]MBM4650969.1 hypothetical protein [Prescottella equi]MBM4686684.1 hypothetical protein [Prescottella equi]